MGFFKSKKGTIISDYFKLTENVAQFKAGNMYEVSLYDEYLELSSVGGSNVKLKYEQITDVYYGLETDIIEKNKSVIGRAVAGGLLFGGLGAVVGGISGTGKKEQKVKRLMLIISYKSSTGSDAFISLEDTRVYKGAKLTQKLKELCKINTDAPEFL